MSDSCSFPQRGFRCFHHTWFSSVPTFPTASPRHLRVASQPAWTHRTRDDPRALSTGTRAAALARLARCGSCQVAGRHALRDRASDTGGPDRSTTTVRSGRRPVWGRCSRPRMDGDGWGGNARMEGKMWSEEAWLIRYIYLGPGTNMEVNMPCL